MLSDRRCVTQLVAALPRPPPAPVCWFRTPRGCGWGWGQLEESAQSSASLLCFVNRSRLHPSCEGSTISWIMGVRRTVPRVRIHPGRPRLLLQPHQLGERHMAPLTYGPLKSVAHVPSRGATMVLLDLKVMNRTFKRVCSQLKHKEHVGCALNFVDQASAHRQQPVWTV